MTELTSKPWNKDLSRKLHDARKQTSDHFLQVIDRLHNNNPKDKSRSIVAYTFGATPDQLRKIELDQDVKTVTVQPVSKNQPAITLAADYIANTRDATQLINNRAHQILSSERPQGVSFSERNNASNQNQFVVVSYAFASRRHQTNETKQWTLCH